VVQEELDLLASVRAALESPDPEAGIADRTAGLRADLLELRETLGDERIGDDQAMIVEQLDRIAALSSFRRETSEVPLDPQSPYFAHLKIKPESEEPRDILLGKRTHIERGLRIVDWRNAPISRVFYQYSEGEPYEEVFGGQERCGDVLARRTVTILDGRLVRVGSPQGSFLRERDGGWIELGAGAGVLAGGEGAAARPDVIEPILGGGEGEHELAADKRLPEIAALLDAEQFALLTRPGGELMVVHGSAGSGKTTVGLHRLAFLCYEDPGRYRPHRMGVVVFTSALARYIDRVLPSLGVDGIPVLTLGRWAAAQRRRHLPRLTPHIRHSTPAAVVRYKSHRLLLPMLEAAAAAAPAARPDELFDELFTDRGWLAEGVRRFAPGQFSSDQLDEIHRWCTDQQFWRADGGGPNEDDRPAYDAEDDMLLLRLCQLLSGPLRHKKKRRLRYDHLMVDEAQDFSPLELKVLLETTRECSATLAGDTAQKIVVDKDFSEWTEVLDVVGQGHVAVSPLEISYRSTRAISEVGRHVLGPLAPDTPLKCAREGSPVELFRCAGMGEAMTFLGDALRDLVAREPRAGVALMTRRASEADAVYQALKRTDLPDLHRVRDGEFTFAPGIEVTDIAQTKGLEFDYVVLLSVDRETFGTDELSRHLLHVGITRAVHQLWMFAWGPPSPLLPEGLKPRLAG